jgi:glycosyltransferase involved in cell wall biosynthesis
MEETARIKALVVCGGLRVGGSEAQLANLLSRLDKKIFDVQVACYDPFAVPGFPEKLLREAYMPIKFLGGAKWSRRQVFSDAIAFMKQERFDLVHAWLASANHYGRIPALISGVPVVIGGMRGKTGFESYWPLVYSLMNLRCSGWIVNSREIKEFVEKKLWFVKHNDIFTIHNGIVFGDDKKSEKSENTFFDELKSNRPVVGIVGTLRPIKNHLLFIEMTKFLTESGVNADYWIIGDGPMKSEIEQAIRKNNLADRVKMLGLRDDVDCALSRMDLFVLTSNSESCPNALLEAMKASLPVVATNCTSLEDVIEEGINGFTVPVGDVQGLCKRVRQLLADDGLRSRMGQASYRIVKERFDMAVAVKELENAYIELLKRKSRTNFGLKEKIQKLGLI